MSEKGEAMEINEGGGDKVLHWGAVAMKTEDKDEEQES